MPDIDLSHSATARSDLGLASGLTGLAGAVDAVGFLKLGGLFTAFMSANSTQAGAYAVLHEDGAMARALALVALYVLGAFTGGVVGWAAGARRRETLLWITAALIAFAIVALRDDRGGFGIALLVLCMGLQTAVLGAAALARGGGPASVTAGLARLGAGLAGLITGEHRGSGWAGEVLIWLSLVLGAAVAAALYARFSVLALVAPALLAVWLAVSEARKLKAARPRTETRP